MAEKGRTLVLAGRTVDLARREVRLGMAVSRLSPKEASLLAYLAARPGLTVSRDELMSEVWGYRRGTQSRTLDTTVRTLRSKLEDDRHLPRFVLTDPGVGYRFQPASPVGASPVATLPPEPGPLVGRDDDLDRVRRRLAAGSRVVTVIGPGGVGKTRLALRLARLAPGAVMIPLVTVRTEAELVRVVAGCLQVAAAEPAIVAALVAQGPRLIVLDNAEQATDVVATCLSRWNQGQHEIQWLVTSRERLRLREERCVALGPLGRLASQALLLDRVLASGAATWEIEPGALDALSAALEGLPLALELAAHKVASWGPEAVVAGLPDRLGVLRDGPTDLPERHSSLEACLRWSWDLLDAEERAELLLCAGRGRTFGLQEVGRTDVFTRLLRQSVVQKGEDGVFFISEAMRSFLPRA